MQSIVAGETTRALTKLYELYPQVSVTLKTGTTTEMKRLILDGELDIAFVTAQTSNRYCKEASIIILSDSCLYLTQLEKFGYMDTYLISRPNHEMTAIEHKFIEINNTI
ncbi:LysR substrate-binding domain-containing protein [Paenibacillus kribbensis]|uniref:LysR substrate-binding domain-containing protein n=1 Tax=Paenibacillus kribbensis TaxID=172713 RepID=UPI002109657D|nr:LysR substrate-binding domain-containing protein [Paenibacillus kribbensis]